MCYAESHRANNRGFWKKSSGFRCILPSSLLIICFFGWLTKTQPVAMHVRRHPQSDEPQLHGALATSKISITSKMVKTWWFPSHCLQTGVKCSLARGAVQIHQQTHILRTRPDWFGQNPHWMSVQLKVMCLFQLTHLERQKENWGESSTNTL